MMDLQQALNIAIVLTGSTSLVLILGALFFESWYHKIDMEMKYEGKNKKFLDWIAIFIDKNINHLNGVIGFVLRGGLLWYLDYEQLLLIWLVSMPFIYILVGVLKWISKKQRPVDARFNLEDFSFPSGHTALATTGFLNIALLLSMIIPDMLWKFEFFFFAIVGGIIVGRSRWYLQVHRISDVLVGLLLGCFCFLFACSLILL